MGTRATEMEASEAVRTLLTFITEGEMDSHTFDTPRRVIKAWANDWGSGYRTPLNFTVFEDSDTDQMVVEMDIPVYSHCAHHLAPIVGVAHVAYIPNGKIVGLSKMNRLVEHFSRRLQVQERLTAQIANTMMKELDPLGVGVVIEAEHFCVSSRGIKHHGCKTVTSKLLGNFLEADVKEEFLALTRK